MIIHKFIRPGYFNPVKGEISGISSLSSSGWVNFSDGSNTVIIKDGTMFLEDSNSTANNQTKALTTMFSLLDSFSIDIVLKFEKLNNSLILDQLATGDTALDGHTVTANVGDAQGGNTTGLSFILVHQSVSMRCVFIVIKAVDYDNTGNIEIWKVNAGIPIAFDYVEFTRVYSGRDIPIGHQFKLTAEYEVYMTVGDRKSYYMTIKKDNKVLVNREICSHNSNYGGNGSMLFQCKGVAERPVSFYVYRVTSPLPIPAKTYPFSIINSGVNGNNTQDIITRLSAINSENAEVAILMIGGNDWTSSDVGKRVTASSYKTSLTIIVSSLKSNGSTVILCSFPPRVGGIAGVEDFLDKIEEVATEQSVHYVDIYNLFVSNNQPNVNSGSWLENMKNYGVQGGVNPVYLGCENMAQKIYIFMKENLINSFTKIICIGDETTYCYGSIGEGTSDGQTYPARLKAKLEYINK